MRHLPLPARLRRAPLTFEQLEARELLAGYQPTAVEQLFLEQLNDARANPAAYGPSIGLDLSSVAPSQPLAWSPSLIESARLHSADMNARAYFSHNTPEGIDPGERMSAAGFPWQSWGESIAGGSAYPGPADALQALIIDAGVPDLGHRRHLLAIDQLFQTQNQVGIGIVQAGSGPLTNYYTIDTAGSADQRPILTGVVMADTNGNGKYDIGEGLGGVTITVSGVGSTTTFDTGGYEIPVQPGVYTVTATGGALTSPIVRTVVVGTTNTRLTLIAGDDAYVQKLYQTVLGRAGSQPEVSAWAVLVPGPGGPAGVAAAIENSPEAHARHVSSWYVSYLGRTPGPAEVQGWVNALLNGATEEQVEAAILGSDEFYLRSTGTLATSSRSNQQYVQRLYAVLLGRSASAVELAAWAAALPTEGRMGTAFIFLTCPEYRVNLITSYYMTILDRQTMPAPGEIGGWVYSGLPEMSLRIALESSPEYFQG
jgi:uncharacterized protein YkwD